MRSNLSQIRAAVDPLGAADADLRRVLLHVHVPLPPDDDHDRQLRPLLPHHQFQVRNFDLLKVSSSQIQTSPLTVTPSGREESVTVSGVSL